MQRDVSMLAGLLPRPIPTALGLPDWFKALAPKAFSPDLKGEYLTIKKCPPVIDAMTYGFLMPLATDLKVENGEFSWQTDWPAGEFANITRSPIGFHDGSQVAGTPFFDEDQFIIKFNNFWTILAARLLGVGLSSDQPRRPAVPRFEWPG